MTNTYDEGQEVRIAVTFTKEGVAADPDTVTLKVKDPSGNTDQYDYPAHTTRKQEGMYYYDLTLDEGGTWYYEWEGDGTCDAVDGEMLYVNASNV